MRDRILEYLEGIENWDRQQQQLQQNGGGALASSVGSQHSNGAHSQNGASAVVESYLTSSMRRGSWMDKNQQSDRPTILEFDTIREAMYEYAGCNLLMDYNRVSTPSRPG